MPVHSELPTPRPRSFPVVLGKRLLDLLVSSLAILLLLPVGCLLAILVRIQMGSPVLYRQVRPGLGGKPFTMFKFRSMTQARDADGKLLPDEQRLNRFGRLLRSSSMDELPELLNVFLGHMSLVGPRPLLMAYLPLYTPEQSRRHEVKPGITGWAQINGRNQITISKRIDMDVWYVDHLGLWLDLSILFLTVPRVLGSRGVAVTEAGGSMDLGGQDAREAVRAEIDKTLP